MQPTRLFACALRSPPLLWLLLLGICSSTRLITITTPVDAAKILVVSPSLSKSIMLFSGRVADALVKAGHNVTFWIPELVPLNSHIDGSRLATIIRTGDLPSGFVEMLQSLGDLFDDTPQENAFFSLRRREQDAMVGFCDSVLRRRAPDLERLREERFQVALTDMIEHCFVGIAHYLGIPQHIFISTGFMPEAWEWQLGVPHPPGYVPSLQDTYAGPRMSFAQRLHNAHMYVGGLLMVWRQLAQENALFRSHINHHGEFPALEELAAATTRVILYAGTMEANPASPLTNKYRFIGGVGMEAESNLPPKLSSLFDDKGRFPGGVVLFTLGSVTPTSTLNRTKMAAIFDAFASFPHHLFLAKLSADDEWSREYIAASGAQNILAGDWWPQSAVLAHPRVRLFISHGGYNSVVESALRGVPMLCIPLFFDQFRDALSVEQLGYSLTLPRGELAHAERIAAAMGKLLVSDTTTATTTTSYAQRAQLYKRILAARLQTPTEVVVSSVERVLRSAARGGLGKHGSEMEREITRLRGGWSKGGMSLLAYFHLDLLAVALMVMALLSY